MATHTSTHTYLLQNSLKINRIADDIGVRRKLRGVDGFAEVGRARIRPERAAYIALHLPREPRRAFTRHTRIVAHTELDAAKGLAMAVLAAVVRHPSDCC